MPTRSTFAAFPDPRAELGPGDVVIVGAGLAGLFTALRLAPLPVTVVAAAPLGQGASSVWAQGGVAAAVGEGDTAEAHARDTVIAGAGTVDEAVALDHRRGGRPTAFATSSNTACRSTAISPASSFCRARRRIPPSASCASPATAPAPPSCRR